jgi:hypothetical protein
MRTGISMPPAPGFRPLALMALLLLSGALLAADSVDLRVGAGPDTSLAGLAGSVDLDPSASLALEANVDFNKITRTAKPDESTDGGLDLDWTSQGAWSGVVGIDGSVDTRDATSNFGPTLSGSWTLAQDGHSDAMAVPDVTAGEILALTLGAGLQDYRVDVGDDTEVATQSGHAAVNAKGVLSLSQLAPSLGLELPLFNGQVLSSLSYTKDYYSSNPTLVARELEQVELLGSGAGRVYSLAAQVYWQEWDFGLAIELPCNLTLNAGWDHAELVSSSEWQDLPSAGLSAKFGDHWSAHLTWSTLIVQGISSPQGEAGAGYQW